MADTTKTLSVLAPAKINLFLHVTGRRDDGFHTLDSLVAFADIGDRITLRPAGEFSFAIDGPFARAFNARERDESPNSANLAVRAVWGLARLARREPAVSLRLTKNLPLAAGLGGGSSDAAAVIWALLEWWGGVPQAVPGLENFLLSLGADVPACMACAPVRVGGIGEITTPVAELEEIPILLVNPLKPCPTASVFGNFVGKFSAPAPEVPEDLVAFLAAQRNDLQAAAQQMVPEIGQMLAAIEAQEGCRLARMSGSGASCFGLFASEAQAREAALNLKTEQPGWWVRAGMLNRPQRY